MAVLLLLGGSTGFVSAQTDTPTPTLTPTATLTPDVVVRWHLPPFLSSGTPVAQEVALSYDVNVGDTAIILLIGAILVSLIIIGLLLRRSQNEGGT